MKVRGRRECQACGTRWSYYETGDIACPDCGSVRSVGVDDRKRHTDAAPDLDLSPYREAVPDDLGRVADDLSEDLRAYLRQRGFVVAGELRPLDDRYLAARELLQAVADLRRGHADRVRAVGADDDGGTAAVLADAEQLYLLGLFRVAAGDDDAERPGVDDVPERFRAARGLADARALSDHRSEFATVLDDDPDPAVRAALGRLRDRLKRVEALEGDVDPETVETLVRASRELTRAAAADDEVALTRARDRLAELD